MIPEARAVLADMTAQIVRQASSELRLVTEEEVLAEVSVALAENAAKGETNPTALKPQTLPPETCAKLERLAIMDRQELSTELGGVLAGHPALAAFGGISGQTFYHAPELLSRTYARILDRKHSPLLLVAEEIRANSRDYPRTVPVELFEAAPFDLTPEELEQVLRAMASAPDYQDITFTTTSSGAVHLFSTRHLERGYAVFLAQQAESLAMNP